MRTRQVRADCWSAAVIFSGETSDVFGAQWAKHVQLVTVRNQLLLNAKSCSVVTNNGRVSRRYCKTMTSDVNAMWLRVFHLLTGLHHAYTIARLVTVDYDGVSHPYLLVMRDLGFRFLTVWTLILQCVYFGMCSMEPFLDANIEGSNPLLRRYQKTRDTIFRAIVFPITLMVTSVFWILFTLDRDLIYPAIVDQHLPPHVNQMMHTSISIVAVLELVLRPHQYRRRRIDITILLLFNCCYLFCYHYTYWTRGVWMYPIYKYLSWNQQQLMNLMLTFVVPIGYYSLGKAIAIKLQGTAVHHLNGTKKET